MKSLIETPASHDFFHLTRPDPPSIAPRSSPIYVWVSLFILLRARAPPQADPPRKARLLLRASRFAQFLLGRPVIKKNSSRVCHCRPIAIRNILYLRSSPRASLVRHPGYIRPFCPPAGVVVRRQPAPAAFLCRISCRRSTSHPWRRRSECMAPQ